MQLNFLLPGLYHYQGGVQVYSRLLLDAVLQVIPPASLRVLSMNDPQELLEPLRREGIRATGFGDHGWPWRRPAFAATALRWSRAENISIVNWLTHLHFSPVAAWASRLERAPFLVSAHGIEAWNIKSPMIRRSLDQADLILPVSEFTRDVMKADLRLPEEAFEVLYNTFNPAEFVVQPKPPHLLSRYGLAADAPVILTVSRLESSEQYKGYDQMLDVMRLVLAAVPGAKYILVGRGDDLDRVTCSIKAKGLVDSVILAGFVPQEELPAHYALCDVFAMPSKKEGFGIVFLEALSCGRPVVAGNKDASVNALKNGELGLLVDPDDTNAIAEATISVLKKTAASPLLFDPDELRRRVTGYFGQEAFRRHVRRILGAYGFGQSLQACRAES